MTINPQLGIEQIIRWKHIHVKISVESNIS